MRVTLAGDRQLHVLRREQARHRAHRFRPAPGLGRDMHNARRDPGGRALQRGLLRPVAHDRAALALGRRLPPPSRLCPAPSMPPVWQQQALACQTNDVPPCDGTAKVCAPAAPSAAGFSVCIFRFGDDRGCPAAYPLQHVFYDGYDDNRACSDCTCGAPEEGNAPPCSRSTRTAPARGPSWARSRSTRKTHHRATTLSLPGLPSGARPSRRPSTRPARVLRSAARRSERCSRSGPRRSAAFKPNGRAPQEPGP